MLKAVSATLSLWWLTVLFALAGFAVLNDSREGWGLVGFAMAGISLCSVRPMVRRILAFIAIPFVSLLSAPFVFYSGG